MYENLQKKLEQNVVEAVQAEKDRLTLRMPGTIGSANIVFSVTNQLTEPEK